MVKKEIKKMVEETVATMFVADDGTEFTNEEQCRLYEESALFAVSKRLKRICNKTQDAFLGSLGYSDQSVDVFNVENETDVDNLKKFIRLTMLNAGADEKTIKSCFEADSVHRKPFVIDNITPGHEVLIFWSYDVDWCWVYGDGSVDAMCEHLRQSCKKAIEPEKE